MGNCQAAETAAVVIQHPTGQMERIYWAISASQVMASNPGHYVALIITSIPKPKPNNSSSHATSCRDSNSNSNSRSKAVKHLKLLRPDDTLHIGHAYHLVSFEEVLKEFASKKHVKLSKLLAAQKERARREAKEAESSSIDEVVEARVEVEVGEEHCDYNRISGAQSRAGQWRSSLQSIAEIGS